MIEFVKEWLMNLKLNLGGVVQIIVDIGVGYIKKFNFWFSFLSLLIA